MPSQQPLAAVNVKITRTPLAGGGSTTYEERREAPLRRIRRCAAHLTQSIGDQNGLIEVDNVGGYFATWASGDVVRIEVQRPQDAAYSLLLEGFVGEPVERPGARPILSLPVVGLNSVLDLITLDVEVAYEATAYTTMFDDLCTTYLSGYTRTITADAAAGSMTFPEGMKLREALDIIRRALVAATSPAKWEYVVTKNAGTKDVKLFKRSAASQAVLSYGQALAGTQRSRGSAYHVINKAKVLGATVPSYVTDMTGLVTAGQVILDATTDYAAQPFTASDTPMYSHTVEGDRSSGRDPPNLAGVVKRNSDNQDRIGHSLLKYGAGGHWAGPPSVLTDAGPNARTLTKTGTMVDRETLNTGHKYGWGYDANGNVANYLTRTDAALGSLLDVALVVAFEIDAIGTKRAIVAYGANGETEVTNRNYSLAVNTTGTIVYEHEYGAGTDFTLTSASTIAAGFHTITLRRDSATRTVVVKVDGVEFINNTYTAPQTPTGGSSGAFYLGLQPGTAAALIDPLDGGLFEARVWTTLPTQAILDAVASPTDAIYRFTPEGTEVACWLMGTAAVYYATKVTRTKTGLTNPERIWDHSVANFASVQCTTGDVNVEVIAWDLGAGNSRYASAVYASIVTGLSNASFKVWGSNDDAAWTDLGTFAASGFTILASAPLGPYRYYKVTHTCVGSTSGNNISEILLLEWDNLTATSTNPNNVDSDLDGTATSVSTTGGGTTTEIAKWDFLTAKPWAKLQMNHQETAAEPLITVRLQRSSDGAAWTDIAILATTASLVTDNIYLEEPDFRYLRVVTQDDRAGASAARTTNVYYVWAYEQTAAFTQPLAGDTLRGSGWTWSVSSMVAHPAAFEEATWPAPRLALTIGRSYWFEYQPQSGASNVSYWELDYVKDPASTLGGGGVALVSSNSGTSWSPFLAYGQLKHETAFNNHQLVGEAEDAASQATYANFVPGGILYGGLSDQALITQDMVDKEAAALVAGRKDIKQRLQYVVALNPALATGAPVTLSADNLQPLGTSGDLDVVEAQHEAIPGGRTTLILNDHAPGVELAQQAALTYATQRSL